MNRPFETKDLCGCIIEGVEYTCPRTIVKILWDYHLPISRGWGYYKNDPAIFDYNIMLTKFGVHFDQFWIDMAHDFIEYRNRIELGEDFIGIEWQTLQMMMPQYIDEKKISRIKYVAYFHSKKDHDLLKKEWFDNNEFKNDSFGLKRHESKYYNLQYKMNSVCYFDLTSILKIKESIN